MAQLSLTELRGVRLSPIVGSFAVADEDALGRLLRWPTSESRQMQQDRRPADLGEVGRPI